MKVGGAAGARTPDPLHAMQVLSQLSYSPVIGPLVGASIGRQAGRTRRPAAQRVSSACLVRRLPPLPARCERGAARTAPASTRSLRRYHGSASPSTRALDPDVTLCSTVRAW